MRTTPASPGRTEGVTLGQAALIVGLAYLFNPVSYAEFTLYPKLVIPGNITATVANIGAHHGQFLGMLFCYLINFIEDIVIAWGLYVLLAPVNRAVSLLAALFQLVYAGIALAGLFNVAMAYRMVTTPEYLASFGSGPFDAQINLLLHTFRSDYSFSLIIFGIHLVLVGFLIVRSGYVPWWLGVILIVNGLGWVVDSLQPYLYPDATLGFVFYTFFGELVFMLWLLIRGWSIPEPA
jgi:hypothetical protein